MSTNARDGTGDADHISDDEEGGMPVGNIYIPTAPKPALSMNATGRRLLITNIINENFNSYHGKQTLGPFHKSFDAIVGPNASGERNIIDSIRFVFGSPLSTRRSKNIGKSNVHMNVPAAITVAVHFVQIIDNDDAEEVPKSYIVVSRTVSKKNSSFYTLNDQRVQFEEVAKMLKTYGIYLEHYRFLTPQVGRLQGIAEGLRVGADAESRRLQDSISDLKSQLQPSLEADRRKLDQNMSTLRELKEEIKLEFLRQENEALKEHIEELGALIITRAIEEGRSLLNEVVNLSNGELDEMIDDQIDYLNQKLNSAENEAGNMKQKIDYLNQKLNSAENEAGNMKQKMQKALKEQQDVNDQLRSYIDKIHLLIVENYPYLLEVIRKQ